MVGYFLMVLLHRKLISLIVSDQSLFVVRFLIARAAAFCSASLRDRPLASASVGLGCSPGGAFGAVLAAAFLGGVAGQSIPGLGSTPAELFCHELMGGRKLAPQLHAVGGSQR